MLDKYCAQKFEKKKIYNELFFTRYHNKKEHGKNINFSGIKRPTKWLGYKNATPTEV